MGNTQVTSLHPVQVAGDPKAPVIVRNESAKTIYYRANPAVSSSLSDGNLTEHQEVTVIQPTWFVTEKQEDGEMRVFPPAVVTPGRRLIHSLNAVLKESLAVGVYFSVAGLLEKATALALSSGENSLDTFYYDPAKFAVGGQLTEVTLDVVVLCDNVEPENKFKFGLYKLEKSEAAEKKLTLTFEAVLAAPLAEVSLPAAKSITHAATTALAPLTAGVYAIGLESTTATTAAKSFEAIAAALYSS